MRIRLPNVPWSSLGAIGRSPAVRLTILVPVLGYILLLNYEFLKLVQLVSPRSWAPEIAGAVSPPWKLMTTYLGLCCLGLASGVFVLMCPRGPKQAASETEFADISAKNADEGSDFVQAVEVAKILDGHLTRLENGANAFHTGSQMATVGLRALVVFNRVSLLLLHYPDAQGKIANYDGLTLLRALAANDQVTSNLIDQLGAPLASQRVAIAKLSFVLDDYLRPKSRAAVWGLYAVGFGLLAVPTIWTVLEVLLQFWGAATSR